LRVASQSAAAALQRRIAAGDSTALPVRTLVEGVLENEGGRLRLSVRLVDAGDGFTLFADRYEGEVGGLFTMEDRIAASIREMLREHFQLPSPDSTSRQKTL
jgi:eukaryotic-like serine/threonine-protein kinase